MARRWSFWNVSSLVLRVAAGVAIAIGMLMESRCASLPDLGRADMRLGSMRDGSGHGDPHRTDDSIYGGRSLHDIVGERELALSAEASSRRGAFDDHPTYKTVVTDPENDAAKDDGELHSGQSTLVSYSIEDQRWEYEGRERIEAYGNHLIALDFSLRYPQLKGDNEHFAAINAELARVAREWVEQAYDSPSEQSVRIVEAVTSNPSDYVGGVPEGSDALLESHVSYVVSYNNEDFLSVCFSDHQMRGSIFGEFDSLRTVNVNLRTGEVYSFDDVLDMTDGVANQFVSTLARNDGSFTPSIYGRDRIVAMLQGGDEESWRVSPSVFVDGNGRANVGVTFWFGKEGVGFSRGWWDVTLTDEQLADARRYSSFWGLF